MARGSRIYSNSRALSYPTVMSLTQLGHYLARRMAHGLKNVSWSKLMRSWVEESDKLIVDWGFKKIGTLRVTRHRTSYTVITEG
jgi:hypothetical protein